MTNIPALKELRITELTKDNIDVIIEALEDTPEEYFDTISKKALLPIYYQARILLKEECENIMIEREEIREILIEIIRDKKTPGITKVEAIKEYNLMNIEDNSILRLATE